MLKLICSILLVALTSLSFSQNLKVGVFQNAPLIYQDAEGRAKGLFINLLEDISKQEGWKLEYVHGSFDSLLQKLSKGEIDIIPDVARSDLRDSLFLFNSNLVIPTWGQVFTLKNDIKTLVDLQGQTISYVRGSYFVTDPESGLKQALENFDIEVNYAEMESIDDVFQAIEKDEVEFAVLNRINGLSYIGSTAGLFNFRELKDTPIVFAPVDLHFAFSLNNPESAQFIARIDEYLIQAKRDPSSYYFQLLDTHIVQPLTYSLPEWIAIFILVISLGLVVLYTFNIILRRRVKKRTLSLEEANLEIKESEQKLKLAIDNSGEGLFEWDIENDEIFIDENFRSISGIGKVRMAEPRETFKNILHEEDIGLFMTSFEKYIENGADGYHNIEFRIISEKSEYRWTSVQGKVSIWKELKPIWYIGTIRDIQEIKDTERSRELLLGELKERNKELKCLYETSQLITNPDLSINQVLESTVKLLPESWQYPSYTCARIKYSWDTYQTENYQETQWSQNAQILVNEEVSGSIEVSYLRDMPEADEGPFLKEERNLINLLSEMMGKMIERKQLDERVDMVETLEREKISKELHDGVQQTLTVATINLNSLDSKLGSQEDLKGKLRNGIDKVSEAIIQIREIAHDLDIDYVRSCEKLIRELEGNGKTKFQFYNNLDQERLDHNMERRLFRITQESINNILKHSNASNATIQLMKYDDLVILTIEDDGIGFDLNAHFDGFGLNSIKNRVSNMNGVCTVDSAPGKGTSITVEVPIINI
jgi:PAS domain S-box-containing protein